MSWNYPYPYPDPSGYPVYPPYAQYPPFVPRGGYAGRGRGRGQTAYPLPAASARTWISPALAAAQAQAAPSVAPAEPTLPPPVAAPVLAAIQHNPPPRPSSRSGLFKNRTLIVDHSAANAVASGSSTIILCDSSPEPESAAQAKAAPVVVEQAFVRTKSGTLVSAATRTKQLLAKKLQDELNLAEARSTGSFRGRGAVRGRGAGRGRGRGRGRGGARVVARTAAIATSTELCPYFTKTGECSKALTCHFVHDSAKISLCPLFLADRCSYSSTTCRLSHAPTPCNTPQCKRAPFCRVASCPYSHADVARESDLCKDFAEKGWCDKGLECRERHVAGCWEFSKRGTCTTAGCKGPHVLMRKQPDPVEGVADEGAGVRWMEDFLGDLTPAIVAARKRKTEDDTGAQPSKISRGGDDFIRQTEFQAFEEDDEGEEEWDGEDGEEEGEEEQEGEEQDDLDVGTVPFVEDDELEFGEAQFDPDAPSGSESSSEDDLVVSELLLS